VADFDESNPQAVSKVDHWAWQSINALRDRGAGPALNGNVGDVLADVGVELPGAAIHGGLLHYLEPLTGQAASPAWIISS